MSDSSWQGLTALGGCCLGLTVITTCLRFCACRWQRVWPTLHDWMIIPTTVLFAALTIAVLVGVQAQVFGVTPPTPKDVSELAALEEKAQWTAKLITAIDFIATPALGLVKICGLLTLRRTFEVKARSKLFNVLTIGAIIKSTLWSLTFVLLLAFVCGTKLDALWTTDLAEYTANCKPQLDGPYGVTVSEFLLSLWVILLSIAQVWHAGDIKRRMIPIATGFIFAILTLVGSIVRMVIWIQYASAGDRPTYADSQNANTRSTYWTIFELGMALTAINVPTLWLLIAQDNALDAARFRSQAIEFDGTTRPGLCVAQNKKPMEGRAHEPREEMCALPAMKGALHQV